MSQSRLTYYRVFKHKLPGISFLLCIVYACAYKHTLMYVYVCVCIYIYPSSEGYKSSFIFFPV